MSIEAYKIAVRIALVENVTAGLANLSRHFMATNRSAEELQNRLTSIGKMTLAGGALLVGGTAGLKMLQEPLNEAKKFETELAKIKALGYGDHVNSEAAKIAKGLNIAGSSANDNLKLVRESLSMMGDLEHVKATLPTLTKMKVGIETVMSSSGHGEGHGVKAERMFLDAIKTAELRGELTDRNTGHIDIKKFNQAMDFFTQAYASTGGGVTPSDFLAMVKTGGVAAKQLNSQAFYQIMPHLMQETGGSRSGTSLMSGYQNWALGRTTQQVAEEMMKAGMLDKSSIHYGKTGHIKKVEPGALKDANAFKENPYAYLVENVLPNLRKKGVKDGQEMQNALDKLYSNRTWGSLISQMYAERELIAIAAKRAANAFKVDQLYETGQKTLAGKEQNYEKRFADLKLELGEKILPLAVHGLELLISGLDRVTKFAKDFPNATRNILIGFAALSGLAVVAGGILLFASAISALRVIYQFTRIGSAFSWVSRVSGMSGMISKVGSVLRGLFSGLGLGLRIVGNAVLFLGRALLFNPIGLIVAAIAAAAYLLYKNWSTVGPYVMKTWEVIKAVFHVSIRWISEKFKMMWDFIKPVVDLFTKTWGMIFDGVKTGLSHVYDFVTGIIGRLWDSLKNSALGKAIGWVSDGVKNFANSTGQVVTSAANNTYQWALQENNKPLFPQNGAESTKGMAGSPYLPSPRASSTPLAFKSADPNSSPVQLTTSINIDGRKVAEAVSMHQSREMNRPGAGSASFDPTIGALPVGMRFVK